MGTGREEWEHGRAIADANCADVRPSKAHNRIQGGEDWGQSFLFGLLVSGPWFPCFLCRGCIKDTL